MTIAPYRYSPATSKQLLAVMERLRNQVWVPYQAALEYQTNREVVTGRLLGVYDAAAKDIDSVVTKLSGALSKYTDSKTLLKAVSDAFDAAKSSLEKTKQEHAQLVPGEKLHDQLTALLEDRVGEPYADAEHKAKVESAEERIKNRIPPGFLDRDKPEKKGTGDVLIWFQLLDYAKKSKKPIVLVTSERKEDWWWREAGKTLGPLPELRREMRVVGGVDFYLYSTEAFLEHARTFLKLAVSEAAIEEARKLQLEDDDASRARQRFLRRRVYGRYPQGILTDSGIQFDPDNFAHLTPQQRHNAMLVDPTHQSAYISGMFNRETPRREFVDIDGIPVTANEGITYNLGGEGPIPAIFFKKGHAEWVVHNFPPDWHEYDNAHLVHLFRATTTVERE